MTYPIGAVIAMQTTLAISAAIITGSKPRTEHYPAVSGDQLTLDAHAAAKRAARRSAKVHGRFDTAPTTGRVHPTDGDYLTKYRRLLDPMPNGTRGTLWERIAEGGQR